MKKIKQTIETQLDCRATASLQESVAKDLEQQDGSLASLINNEVTAEDDHDETNLRD